VEQVASEGDGDCRRPSTAGCSFFDFNEEGTPRLRASGRSTSSGHTSRRCARRLSAWLTVWYDLGLTGVLGQDPQELDGGKLSAGMGDGCGKGQQQFAGRFGVFHYREVSHAPARDNSVIAWPTNAPTSVAFLGVDSSTDRARGSASRWAAAPRVRESTA
jgi:hypothetical protein